MTAGDESWCLKYDPPTKCKSVTWKSPGSSKAMKLWLQDCMPGHWGYSKNGIKHVGVSCSKSNINLQHIFLLFKSNNGTTFLFS